MKCCINGGYFIKLLHVSIKLFKFEIQKCGRILCAHKPYFLMPGHIYIYICMYVYIYSTYIQYISPLLFKILKFCELHLIPYEMLHKWKELH